MSNPQFFRMLPWKECLAQVTDVLLDNFAAWRSFTKDFVNWLVAQSLLGFYPVSKNIQYPCLPVYDLAGNFLGEHIFTGRRGNMKAFYTDGARPMPLIIGKPSLANEWEFFEGQWDAFSVADATGWYHDTGKIFAVSRGATNAKTLKGIVPNGAKIYLWPQNDDPAVRVKGKTPAESWTFDLGRAYPDALVAPLTESAHDHNDALRAGFTNFQKCRDMAFPVRAINNSGYQQSNRTLRGASIIEYAERKIDFSKNLIANRWLSIGQGAFFVAPSGHGKSTWVIQTAACWGCGRSTFALSPARPLRVLIVQSEDDDNDVIEMSMLTDRLNLSQAERTLVKENTQLEWVNDVTGKAFFSVLDSLLTAWAADMLIINPYSAYQGGEITDDKLNNEFLRVRLSALLARHNCGALAVHHTAKTQFQKLENFSWYDWMYSMAGGASLTNWARAVLIMVPSPTVPGTYKFIAAKRFEKIGWKDREYWFSHSIENGKFLWVPSTQAQIAASKTGAEAGPDDLLTLIPVLDPVPEVSIIVAAKTKLKIGRDRVRDFLSILLQQGKIFEHEIPRPKKRPEIRYSQTQP